MQARQWAMAQCLPSDPDLIPTHTTAAAASVARWVEQYYGMAVQQCHLIRRGLNDNYAVHAADGRRYVARLYSIRPRGPFNIEFEVALLSHLQANGVGAAGPVWLADGRTHVPLQFPEGPRALALFCHAHGVVPDTLEDFELTGRTLALIHGAAREYAGPPSRYLLDGTTSPAARSATSRTTRSWGPSCWTRTPCGYTACCRRWLRPKSG